NGLDHSGNARRGVFWEDWLRCNHRALRNWGQHAAVPWTKDLDRTIGCDVPCVEAHREQAREVHCMVRVEMGDEHGAHVIEWQLGSFELSADPYPGVHQIVLLADDYRGGNTVTMLAGTRGPPAWSACCSQRDNSRCKTGFKLHSLSFKCL